MCVSSDEAALFLSAPGGVVLSAPLTTDARLASELSPFAAAGGQAPAHLSHTPPRAHRQFTPVAHTEARLPPHTDRPALIPLCFVSRRAAGERAEGGSPVVQ